MKALSQLLILGSLILTVTGLLEKYSSDICTLRTATGSVKVPRASLDFGQVDPSVVVGKMRFTAHVDSATFLKLNPDQVKK